MKNIIAALILGLCYIVGQFVYAKTLIPNDMSRWTYCADRDERVLVIDTQTGNVVWRVPAYEPQK